MDHVFMTLLLVLDFSTSVKSFRFGLGAYFTSVACVPQQVPPRWTLSFAALTHYAHEPEEKRCYMSYSCIYNYLLCGRYW